MDEKLSKLKEQISKIDDLKNVATWGPEYQMWLKKTEKLVEDVFGQESLELFNQQRTTVTSYLDESFNVRQYLKELDNRKKILKGLLAEMKEYDHQPDRGGKPEAVDIIKEIWRKEQALKENLLPTEEAKAVQESLLNYLEKVLPDDSIPGLRFRKLRAQKRFQTWWTNNNGYPTENPWGKIEPFLEILQQHEAEKTIKNRLETEGLFVESRHRTKTNTYSLAKKTVMQKRHTLLLTERQEKYE